MGSEIQGLCQVSASGLVLGSQASPYQSYLDNHSTPNTTFISAFFVDLVFLYCYLPQHHPSYVPPSWAFLACHLPFQVAIGKLEIFGGTLFTPPIPLFNITVFDQLGGDCLARDD
jgi:hypothetical protein